MEYLSILNSANKEIITVEDCAILHKKGICTICQNGKILFFKYENKTT